MIIPKRHAKRSVTRTLVKRQVRALWLARQPELPSGDWVVRLRAPLDRKVFTSAASEPLKDLLAQELRVVFADAARRATRAVKAAQAERTAPPMSALIDVGLVTPAAPPGEARS